MIIGIDVSKDKLDVCVLPENEHYKIKNSAVSIRSFFKNKLKSLEKMELVVFESTGGYEKLLQKYLMEKKLAYHRAHPNKVVAFAKFKGYFAKTDRIDAEILAKYGEEKDICADREKTEKELKMREFSSRKQQLKDIITRERQRLNHVYLETAILRSIKRSIKQMQQELLLIQKALDEQITSDEDLSEKQRILKSTKGIGHEVSSLLITDLPELGRLSREQISHLVGVAPKNRDSGQKTGYRHIGKGRFHVRKGLFMAALVASKHNPRMKLIYDRLLQKGKEKKVALVAVMRKMIIMLNAMIKNRESWQCERI